LLVMVKKVWTIPSGEPASKPHPSSGTHLVRKAVIFRN
jgi:hypothetical protein